MSKKYTDADLIKEATKPLLCWYQDAGRILPWRENPSPYGTWISEIMLQQTRVEAVINYYYRFMERFPDIETLAKAEEDDVFALWQGLGYYRRGSLLLQCAKVLCREYQGTLPADYEKLLALPGIGRYTAGAIASIGFNLAYPAVDGNVLRVISRLLGSSENVSDEKVKRKIEALLQEAMPKEESGIFNQSLMELGALICIPNGAPKCDKCPVKIHCRGYQLGIAQELPHKEKKKPRKIETRTVFVFRAADQVLIHQRQKTGLLAKLWEYPNREGHLSLEDVKKEFPQGEVKILGEAKHIFTHIEWHMLWYEIIFEEPNPVESCLWVQKEALGNYAIASAFKKVLK